MKKLWNWLDMSGRTRVICLYAATLTAGLFIEFGLAFLLLFLCGTFVDMVLPKIKKRKIKANDYAGDLIGVFMALFILIISSAIC